MRLWPHLFFEAEKYIFPLYRSTLFRYNLVSYANLTK